MVYVLYNANAGAHYGRDKVEEKIRAEFPNEEIILRDTIVTEDKKEYISHISPEDKLVIVGGDGTLNRFVNAVEEEYPFPIYCYAGGTGNDFINDVVGTGIDSIVEINKYIKSLPEIEVNGTHRKFINGIGYGIDGWCCEVGDIYRDKTGKAPNYTAIALKGLLYKFKTVNAKVTVDGETREYKNVWMVPTMNGRYFGGGMMVTPEQNRLNADRELSIVIVQCKSRFKLLTVFPKIFKGKHTKHTDVFEVIRGREVSVEFDRPIALQIDGETVLGVREYKAKSSALIKKKEECTV